MTLHMKVRATERCPNIDQLRMQHAVETHIKTGYHDEIDYVMNTSTGLEILRHNQGEIVTYPVIDRTSRDIITIYTQKYVTSLKRRDKFKKKILRSRKNWKGKT